MKKDIKIHLNKDSLFLHTRLRTITFQQKSPVSIKNTSSKVFCSSFVVDDASENVEAFVRWSLSPCVHLVLSLSKIVLSLLANEASLLSPQTISRQNPMLQK